MTDDRMTLIEFVEKEADADLVLEMLAFAAERVNRHPNGPPDRRPKVTPLASG